MKSEMILNAIGQIDDSFIEEAAPKVNTIKKRGWVKWGAIAACAVLMLSIFIPKLFTNIEDKPTPGDLRPMIFVNDTLYLDTGKVYQHKLDNFIYIGEVTSVVSENEEPAENFQANYVSVGSEVYQYGENIIIFVNDIYSEYQKAEETP